jgi:hypothetical protein
MADVSAASEGLAFSGGVGVSDQPEALGRALLAGLGRQIKLLEDVAAYRKENATLRAEIERLQSKVDELTGLVDYLLEGKR